MQVQYNDNLKEKCLVVLAVTLIHSYALIYFIDVCSTPHKMCDKY